MMRKELTRRSFLKSAALGAAGLAAAGMGGAALAAGQEPAWDREAEVVVVGTGTAIIAAIAAAEFGAQSVIVLEKDPYIFGGTSITSGGGYALPGTVEDLAAEGIADSREDVLAYMKAVGEDRMDQRPQISFVDHANDFCQWAKGVFGWSRWGHASRSFGDYYEAYAGSIPTGFGRGNTAPYDGEGNAMYAAQQWACFQSYVENSDVIQLMMGTAAAELITDEAGAVMGLYAVEQEGGARLAIRATRGVVLGTGGFDFNEQMRRDYLPFPLIRSCVSKNDTGDGHIMGARIGAKLALMDRVMGVPFPYEIPLWQEGDNHNYGLMEQSTLADWCSARSYPHSIIVNRKGRRFANEGAMYDVFNRAFGAYDTGSFLYENIPGYWICDANFTDNFMFPGGATADKMPEFIFKFDSLEELAEGMGIDRENLLAEVARFNENAGRGVDPDWHRGESENIMNSAAMMAAAGAFSMAGGNVAMIDTPASVLGPVEKPPFYCCRYVPGSLSTRGGLQVNGKSQVENYNGEAIPGLYAAGNCSTGVAGYWAGGANISQGTVMSYVAALSIMGLE